MLALYLRSRQAYYAALVLLGIAGLAWVVVEKAIQVDGVTVRVLLTIPLSAAMIIGVSTETIFGDLEHSAKTWLPVLRLIHLSSLCGLAGLAFSIILLPGGLEGSELLIIGRNLAGFTGLAFFGARLIGSRLSWIIPAVYLVLIVAGGTVEQNGQQVFPIWAWALREPSDHTAFIIAFGLLAAGFASICISGARQTSTEDE